VIISACLVGGCAEQDDDDYCENHYLFHESHADKTAKLDIAYLEDGLVTATVSLPHSIFGGEGVSSGATIDEIAGILNDSENVFTVQAMLYVLKPMSALGRTHACYLPGTNWIAVPAARSASSTSCCLSLSRR